jgi:hypothetical protein
MMPGFDVIPSPPGSDALDAPAWFAAACELEGENRALIQALYDLLVWISEREQLCAFFNAEAARRWAS